MSEGIKKIAFAFNPISGKGRSKTESERVFSELRALGYQCSFIESEEGLHANFDLLILAGGDGTLRRFLPKLIETQVPVYMLPTGNESLFSKEFSMSLDIKKILKSIQEAKVSSGFIPTINGEPFFSMISIGLDSQVVCELTKVRKGPVNHLSYVWPSLKSLWNHKSPQINLKVDGQLKLNNENGFLLIGNTKQYALGIRFVPQASSNKEKLSAVFIPYGSVFAIIFIYILKIICPKFAIKKSQFFEGDKFEINCLQFPVQVDGDYMPIQSSITVISGICLIKILQTN